MVQDEWGDHAIQCMVGGDHTTFHDAAADELARFQRAAGLRSRREVVVPALAKPGLQEPRADLETWGSAALPHQHSDFTLVSPWAARNLQASAAEPGKVARLAETAKTDKYAVGGGTAMVGLAMEAGGRHGPQLAAHLGLLASLARQQSALRWRPPRPWLRDWRTRLAVLLGRFTAAAVASAMN